MEVTDCLYILGLELPFDTMLHYNLFIRLVYDLYTLHLKNKN